MKQKLTHEEISSFSLELSLLLHAGVTVGDALALLADESGPDYHDLLDPMAQAVDDGASLSQALRQSGAFPVYVCGLVEVGERSGRTEEALRALSEYYEGRSRMGRKLRSALLYPAVMLVLMLVVIGVLLVKVLPIFDEVYASLGGRLTGVAGGLLALGRLLDKAMPVLWALLALAVVLLAAFAAVESFRDKILARWQKNRGDRGIARKLNNARLAQALAMGMASGLPTEESLSLAAGLMSDAPAAKARCEDCLSRLERGSSLAEALKGSQVMPAAQCRLLELAQRSGAGDSAMEKIAADLSEESEYALEEAVSRVEPALVLVCSVLVGLILLSVMLPLMHIMAAIG